MSLALAGTSYWLAKETRFTDLILPRAFAISKEDDDNLKKPQRKRYSDMNFIADIVENVSKSVVFLECEVRNPFFGNTVVSLNSGSGFLVCKKDGVILTNAHVIANTNRVIVKLNDGRVVEGKVEFVNDSLDLATVRIPPAAVRDLDEIPLGNSKKSRSGEFVIAVGAPLTLSNTVTFGIISSISRAGRELGMHGDVEYIQTDASINVGNSGGPLVNLDGEAIGINTLKVGEGISFAVPSDYAAVFLQRANELRHRQSSHWWGGSAGRTSPDPYGKQQNVPVPTRRKFVGLTMVTLTPSLIEQLRAREFNFPNVKSGVFIHRVVLGSPAHMSGIQAGDIIIEINGKEVKRPDDVYHAMEQYDVLKVHIKRQHEDIILKVQPQIIE